MTSWVAHDMGYVDQLNFTFSQTNYWDEIIPKQIASDLKHEWIFKALDNGLWLKEVDRVTGYTGGNVIYYGTAHGESCMRYINFDEFGLLHSGQIGDGINGSYLTSTTNGEFRLGMWATSEKYINNLHIDLEQYQDAEIGCIYTRALNGVINGQQYEYNYTETLSPFLDLDFVEACFNMPLELRENHYLYNQWVLKKYPKAADYVWEAIGCKITEPTIHFAGRVIPTSRIIPKIINRIKANSGTNTKKHMNPIGYYLSKNEELKEFIDSYFGYKDLIKDDIIFRIVADFELHGTTSEKLQAVTLLSTLKLFYR